jgi:hypothetical protein
MLADLFPYNLAKLATLFVCNSGPATPEAYLVNASNLGPVI